MTIKTFKCVVCAAEVTKPKSYAFQGGRACRTHEEACSAHQAAEKAIKDKLQAHKVSKIGSEVEKDFVSSGKNPARLYGIRDPNTYCWRCSKEGIYETQVFTRFLVNMSKAKLKGLGESNPFSEDSPHYQLTRQELGERVVLKRFPLPERYPIWKIKQLTQANPDILWVSQTAKMVVLCYTCAHDFGFDWNFDRVDLSKISLKSLALLGDSAKEAANEVAMKEILTGIFYNPKFKENSK